MKLSIIIVNYNVKYYIEQCIYSIIKSGIDIEYEIIVTDNNSNDGSISYLKELYPNITYIENKENLGFAKANNQAIKIAKGEYIMLLNPDTILGESTLYDCVTFMDKTPDAGALGVKMLKSNGSFALESRRGIPTPLTSMYKMLGLCKLFPKSKIFGKYYMQYLDNNKPAKIEIISGACMFIRKSTLDISGPLDEDFFMYGEDIDLSYRLLKTGMKNYYIPTPIIHYKGESTEKTSYRYVYVFYKAMLIFFRKHYSHYGILLSIPIQGAIYFKGFCSFINQQFKKLVNKANEKQRPGNYLIISSVSNPKEMISILDENNLKYEIISLNHFEEEIHTSTPSLNCDYIVFDTTKIEYKKILEHLITSSQSSNPPKLATYYPHTNIIITEDKVYCK